LSPLRFYFLRKVYSSHSFRWLLRHHARDLRAIEDIVKASNLHGPLGAPLGVVSQDANFRALPDALPGSSSMSFRAVAAFMLEAVERAIRTSIKLSICGLSNFSFLYPPSGTAL
jgi:hypothetical protein